MKVATAIFGLVVLILILVGIYFFITGGQSSTVSLEFEDIEEIVAGKAFSLGVAFSNSGDDVLKNARLSLVLPDGVHFFGESVDQRVREKFVGDVGPGSLSREEFVLVVDGGGEEVNKIVTANLTYNTVAGGDGINFKVTSDKEFSVRGPAVRLEIETPEEVAGGESFDVRVEYLNDGDGEVKNLVLKLDFPANFDFKESSVQPDIGSSGWRVPSVAATGQGEVIVTGNLVGQDGQEVEIAATLLTEEGGESYVVDKKMAKVRIKEAKLSLSISVNDVDEYIAKTGDVLEYLIVYRNNSTSVVEDVSVEVGLMGEMFNFAGLNSNGYWNSGSRTVLWNANNISDLREVAPGEGGSFEMRIPVKDNFEINRISDRDFALRAKVSVKARGAVISVVENSTKVAGKFSIETLGLFRDAASGILNSGVFPPRSGAATQFTIHWKLRNYATDLSGVEVSATLPDYVSWTGKTKISGGEGELAYSSESRKVIWMIDKVRATRGVVGDPLEAIFQVSLMPQSSQVGQVVDIVASTLAQARDDFTGMVLSASDIKIDTNLPDDPTVVNLTKTIQPQ